MPSCGKKCSSQSANPPIKSPQITLPRDSIVHIRARRRADAEKIIEQIVAGAKGARELHVEPDRKKAIEFALAEAGPDDVVIIAGKGHETTQEIKGVKHPFDDREVVRCFGGEA